MHVFPWIWRLRSPPHLLLCHWSTTVVEIPQERAWTPFLIFDSVNVQTRNAVRTANKVSDQKGVKVTTLQMQWFHCHIVIDLNTCASTPWLGAVETLTARPRNCSERTREKRHMSAEVWLETRAKSPTVSILGSLSFCVGISPKIQEWRYMQVASRIPRLQLTWLISISWLVCVNFLHEDLKPPDDLYLYRGSPHTSCWENKICAKDGCKILQSHNGKECGNVLVSLRTHFMFICFYWDWLGNGSQTYFGKHGASSVVHENMCLVMPGFNDSTCDLSSARNYFVWYIPSCLF